MGDAFTIYGANYNFSLTGGELIIRALNKIGAFDPAENIPSTDMAAGLMTLNMMVKQYMGNSNKILPGLKIWKRDNKSLLFSIKDYLYSIATSGADVDMDDVPVEILSLIRRDTSQNDTLLSRMSINEYRQIGNKSIESTPTKYYYELKTNGGMLYFNCKVSDITQTYEMRYLAPFKDIVYSTVLDFQQWFYRPLLYALCEELAPDYGIPERKAMEISNLKKEAFALAGTFEPEETQIYFEPGRD